MNNTTPVATPTLNNKSKPVTLKAFAEVGASVEDGDYAATVSNVKRFAPRSTRIGFEFTIRGGKFDGEKVTLLTKAKERRTKWWDLPGVNDGSVESQVTAILGRKLTQEDREGDFDLEHLIGKECYVGVVSINSRKDGAVWTIKSKVTARLEREVAILLPKSEVATAQPKTEVAADQRWKCPSCKSDNIRKLSLVYKEGCSDISTTTKSSGVAVGLTAGGLGVGVGSSVGHARGDQQTLLSKIAAPPPRTKPKKIARPRKPSPPREENPLSDWAFLGAIFVPPFLYWFNLTPSYWLAVFIFLGIWIWSGCSKWTRRWTRVPTPEQVDAYNKELSKYERALQRYPMAQEHENKRHAHYNPLARWERSYLCMKCEKIFDPRW